MIHKQELLCVVKQESRILSQRLTKEIASGIGLPGGYFAFDKSSFSRIVTTMNMIEQIDQRVATLDRARKIATEIDALRVELDSLLNSRVRLADAIREVLTSANKPLSVDEIVQDLDNEGFQFKTNRPKSEVFIRIYKVKGVKKVSPGVFALK